ncbi:MAG: DNA-directed DNA polymerase II small subunit [Euryarchaeota archaeon]|nr:DNA-directed DNA polymerase II small subunit [Euryarchaeota archaeon]
MSSLDAQEKILTTFLSAGFQLHPEALSHLLTNLNLNEVAEKLIKNLNTMQEKPIVLTKDIVETILNEQFKPTITIQESSSSFEPLAKKVEPRIEVLEKEKPKYSTKGTIEDFIKYFNNRYEKIKKILLEHTNLRDASTISGLKALQNSTPVKIIGLISNIRTTAKGNKLLEIEDQTGKITVLISNDSEEAQEKAKHVILDEVIGIEGTVARNGELLIAKDIIWPDTPVKKEQTKAEDPICIGLLSDLHVGSKMFLKKEFERFLKWLNTGFGNPKQKELASRIKYLIIAGDLVDGVGVYPDQEKELEISDIHQQYIEVAKLLEQIPDYIEIIITPGNHDAIRIAEPQPPLPRDIAAPLFELDNVHMLGNPARVNIHGFKTLIYHGRSLDDITSAISGLSLSQPELAMVELLKRRHLAPIYGERALIAPEAEDLLVIDEIPDIFQAAHAHTVGLTNYRGVITVNSGAWQSQTAYQKTQGLTPTPARLPIVDLQSLKTTILRFGA